jgi:hypothetical protein
MFGGKLDVLGPEISGFEHILADAKNFVFDFGLFVAFLVERDACDADAVLARVLIEMFDLGIWVDFGNLSVDLGAIAAQRLLGLLGGAGSVWVEAVGGGSDCDFHILIFVF